MNIEIERKFLLPKGFVVSKLADAIIDIKQGYLSSTDKLTTRVRLSTYTKLLVRPNQEAYLTIKHNDKESNLSHSEFEYQIPWEDGVALFGLCTPTIEKARHVIHSVDDGYTYEIDVFKGKLDGLVVCEVEFKSEEEANAFSIPVDALKDVTDDKRFSNAYLASATFTQISDLMNEVYGA